MADQPAPPVNLGPKQSPPTYNRIETDHYVIHLEPRISAAKLAEYVIADPSRQETIVRGAKRGSKAIMIPYTRVRHAFGDALTPSGLSDSSLLARANEIDGAHSKNTWQQDDNIRSASALRRLAALATQIACAGAERIHKPADGWPPLHIHGVRVSVQPELVFVYQHRGIRKVGAIILNMGKGESLSLGRSNGRATAGDYLSLLVYRMIDHNLASYGPPLHTQCRAIDVFRDTIYTTPASHKTMLKHIDAACRTIALQWDNVSVEADVEELADF